MAFNSRKGAHVINADLWRIWNDCAKFRALRPPYKWQFCCSVTHILEILPFMVGVSNLREMEFRSLNISAGSSSKDFGSTSLDFHSWELCFSLVSPLWESCYFLASC